MTKEIQVSEECERWIDNGNKNKKDNCKQTNNYWTQTETVSRRSTKQKKKANFGCLRLSNTTSFRASVHTFTWWVEVFMYQFSQNKSLHRYQTCYQHRMSTKFCCIFTDWLHISANSTNCCNFFVTGAVSTCLSSFNLSWFKICVLLLILSLSQWSFVAGLWKLKYSYFPSKIITFCEFCRTFTVYEHTLWHFGLVATQIKSEEMFSLANTLSKIDNLLTFIDYIEVWIYRNFLRKLFLALFNSFGKFWHFTLSPSTVRQLLFLFINHTLALEYIQCITYVYFHYSWSYAIVHFTLVTVSNDLRRKKHKWHVTCRFSDESEVNTGIAMDIDTIVALIKIMIGTYSNATMVWNMVINCIMIIHNNVIAILKQHRMVVK